MTELTISQIVDIGAMTPFLDRQLLDLACSQLYNNMAEVRRQILSTGTLQRDFIQHLKNTINTIGLFPYELGLGHSFAKPNPWIMALVSAYYDLSLMTWN